ncbi:hypothetical protein BC830DRAFT_1165691 [Chytriomyces sp. MP71]|nr:hypothetical protein BC830DRAFT_1165691 [Chytriomyces sp. MP71]
MTLLSIHALCGDAEEAYMPPVHLAPLPCPTEANQERETRPSKAKRAQVKNACTNCKQACKRCDVQRPCTRCVQRGTEDSCMDSQRKPRQIGIRGPYKKKKLSAESSETRAAGIPSDVKAESPTSSVTTSPFLQTTVSPEAVIIEPPFWSPARPLTFSPSTAFGEPTFALPPLSSTQHNASSFNTSYYCSHFSYTDNIAQSSQPASPHLAPSHSHTSALALLCDIASLDARGPFPEPMQPLTTDALSRGLPHLDLKQELTPTTSPDRLLDAGTNLVAVGARILYH